MAMGPESAAIRLSAEDERKIGNMTEGELIQYMHTLAEQQGLATRDPFSNELIHTELSQNAPRTLSRSLTINGTTYTVEGANEQELTQCELELHRAIQAEAQAEKEQPREANGRYAANVEDPIVTSQVEAYLKNRGINPEDLQTVAGRGFEQRWTSAAEAWVAAHPNWQGGEAAKNALGQKLIAMGLVDEPSVESLNAAYEALQREGGLPDNPEIAVAQKIGEAKSFQDIQAALGRTSSSVFGGYR